MCLIIVIQTKPLFILGFPFYNSGKLSNNILGRGSFSDNFVTGGAFLTCLLASTISSIINFPTILSTLSSKETA